MSHGHVDAPVEFSLVEVADGVFGYIQPDGTWMINNTGFIVSRTGVSAIDACSTERRTRAFLTTISGVTRAPVRTLVNTHHHPDHTAGNGLVTGAAIVPGHGPVGGPELIEPVLGYLRFIANLAAEGRAAGVSPLELARGTDLGQYAAWSDPERTVGNLHRAYADLARPDGVSEARG